MRPSIRSEGPRHGVQSDEPRDMEQEYHPYDLGEDAQHAKHLARGGHVHEDAEYVERQQRQDHRIDGHAHHVAEFARGAPQRVAAQVGYSQSEHEGEHEGGHDAHDRRYLHREVGRDIGGFGGRVDLDARGYERRKDRRADEIRREARGDRGGVGQGGGEGQHAPRVATYVGDGGRHESRDDERNGEAEQLPEHLVERDEYAYAPLGQQVAAQNTERDGGRDARQKSR